MAIPVQARKPSRLRKTLKSLKIRLVNRGYDSWVASALAEEDPLVEDRVSFQGVAVEPDVSARLGAEGQRLVRPEEIRGGDCVLRQNLGDAPTALAWYKKGICCHHLGRREEALRCFDQALKACPSEDRQLLEDAARMKKLVEDELRGA